ncbi:MAG: methionine--tRNA ligase, partial [Oscillospiraceae bacterium]|nr:methionine--tRNA ligase [Oscillospiraceae bacterium]
TTPWALAKDVNNFARLQEVLYNLLEGIRFLGVLLKPFMPETSESIRSQINSEFNTFDTLV